VAGRVGDHDAHRQLPQHALEPHLGGLEVGHVDHHHADAGDIAVHHHREPARQHVAHMPGARLLGGQLTLEDRLAALEDVLVDRDQHARHLRQHIVEPAADVLLARAPVDGAQRRIDAHEPKLGVDEREPDRRTFADDIEQRAGLAR
jgi:hypothetical protein